MKDGEYPAFGCWQIDPETGKKVPGVNPRNMNSAPKPKAKPKANPTAASEE